MNSKITGLNNTCNNENQDIQNRDFINLQMLEPIMKII